jgi:hypothetical protein
MGVIGKSTTAASQNCANSKAKQRPSANMYPSNCIAQVSLCIGLCLGLVWHWVGMAATDVLDAMENLWKSMLTCRQIPGHEETICAASCHIFYCEKLPSVLVLR